jgi:putative tricarboxylic transport membrane protein
VSAADATAPPGDVGDGHSTPTDRPGRPRGWSDRVLGVVFLAIAIWYTIEARTFDGTAFGSGPVGPKTLPTGIGVLFGVLSVYLIVKPDLTPPRWATAAAWWQIGLVVLSSYVYGRLIEPIGFIAASTAMMMIVGLLFGAPLRALVPASVIFSVAVAFVFNNWLELRLPVGWWGGFSS